MRRDGFLKIAGGLGAGLTLGFRLAEPASASGEFTPNAYVRIAPDDSVTVYVSKSEMGQGVATGMVMTVAEELEYPIERLKIEFAPAGAAYIDPVSKKQGTGGSTSTQNLFEPMRQMGATARAMLIAAAAKQWDVDPATLVAQKGTVTQPSTGRVSRYGALAATASTLPVPKDVTLKSFDQFHVIGQRLRRFDIPYKVNGSAKYGLDVRLPGMLYASVQKPPVFGGKVAHVDATETINVKGVKQVVPVSSGVAVIATNSWSAMQGRFKLAVSYIDGPLADTSSQSIFDEAEFLTKKAGVPARSDGNAETALQGPNVKTVSSLYRGPYLAHAAMEPMNATAWIHNGLCEVWAPTQGQTEALEVASKLSGLPQSACRVYTTFLGGGFGRKSESDAVADAVEAAKAAGVPVKVVYTREDDMQHDFYRSTSTNAVTGAVDEAGRIVALQHRVVTGSINRRTYPDRVTPTNYLDPGSVNGAANILYDIPNIHVDFVEQITGIPIGHWRAPGANWNTFVTESFIDELAHAAGKDPYIFRRAHLKSPRALAVLDAVTQKAGWHSQPAAGTYRGLAFGAWGASLAAMVVEASFGAADVRVHRIVVAGDCGLIINPDVVEAQLQSAAIYGLAAALTGKITIAKGRVQQNNFYDYTVLRHDAAPRIETVLIASTAKPTGIGELSTPPVAPALANAYFSATGKRVRQLPLLDAMKTA
jgi:isoquinoline 1-oxidoreductase beta subunit